jgi:hypothetical protein
MMAEETSHTRARKVFEQLGVGEKISAVELASGVGATTYHEKKNVAAFLSKQAKRGRVQKHVGEDGRVYYEKVAVAGKPALPEVATPGVKENDTVTFGEIGESIFTYILKMKERISELAGERDEIKEKISLCVKEKEDFERLYREAASKIEQLFSQQREDMKTVKVSEITGEE